MRREQTCLYLLEKDKRAQTQNNTLVRKLAQRLELINIVEEASVEVPIGHQEEIMKRYWTEDAMERQSKGKNRRQPTWPTMTYNTDLTIHTKRANNLIDGLAEHWFENKSL